MAAYGVDVLDPAVSVRRLHVLLEHLPPTARRGGESWSTESELLAHLIDHVAYLTWITIRANGGKTGKPKPIKRPPERRDLVATAKRRAGITAGSGNGNGGPVKTGSWAEAFGLIAGNEAVRVRNG